MRCRELGPDGSKILEQILGYLNFSSGATDPHFLANLNAVFGRIEEACTADTREPSYRVLHQLLSEKLCQLEHEQQAFRDVAQARAALDLSLERVPAALRQFHGDLLFHQSDQGLFRPFLVGRICEAVLQQGPPWDAADAIAKAAVARLNDYLGYRPVAMLEGRRCEPYAHERVCVIPLYLRDVGVAVGPYRPIIERALQILRHTDPILLRDAGFDADRLLELALDPRAYDFDHPANKRPNHHFGLWDPDRLDSSGYYCRFILHHVTLDALWQRIHTTPDLAEDQLVTEAAAVLAGTMLMASGISGDRPSAHDSTVTLGNLLPRIADYRDVFYQQLIPQLHRAHATRLQQEARRLHQPFGGARQHLNARLTDVRATQLARARLAVLFARMGYPEAARRQLAEVPVASSRLLCQIFCQLATAGRLLEMSQFADVLECLQQIHQTVLRGIECGAMVDPWCILGFDGNFPIFHAMENAIQDHRVDELVELLDGLFTAYDRLWCATVVAGETEQANRVSQAYHELAVWWHQFAAHELTSVHSPDPLERYEASQRVAEALAQWYQHGRAAGDVRFWVPHAAHFACPKAYSRVVELLLEQRDYVAAMGLLIHWLEQADRVPLEEGDDSFHDLIRRWLMGVLDLERNRVRPDDEAQAMKPTARCDRWLLVRKFLDYLEANAGSYWQAPQLDMQWIGHVPESGDDESPDEYAEESDEDLFGAAYEGVVYRDSTDDGMDSSLYETGGSGDDELDHLHQGVAQRLAFLRSLGWLWRVTAVALVRAPRGSPTRRQSGLPVQVIYEALENGLAHLQTLREGLWLLTEQVGRLRLLQPSGDYQSMIDYDRQRTIKESLLDQVMTTNVDLASAAVLMVAALADTDRQLTESVPEDWKEDTIVLARSLRALLHQEDRLLEALWPSLLEHLRKKPFLYVPLARGGNPRTIVQVRIRQSLVRLLLCWLPRRGFMTQSRELINTIRVMERAVPVGPGAVSEFDDVFELGYRAVVDCLLRAISPTPRRRTVKSREAGNDDLITCMESLTESFLVIWLAHSRTLRLSVLERLHSPSAWQSLVRFIKRYGHDLFTQQFFNLANLRGILYQGVDTWLHQLQENGSAEWLLVAELDRPLPRQQAVRHLTLVLEAVADNYDAYRDYNSTTTQSDRGEMIYTLLDFLRLLSSYERVAWNLKPVVLAHEILVRNGHHKAAQIWRRALTERIGSEADRFLNKLTELQKRYAMRLPTIADRLGERFLSPMTIDRLRAQVRPAMLDLAQRRRIKAFGLLEDESCVLIRQPSGVGYEPPAWLGALEEEVDRVSAGYRDTESEDFLGRLIPTRPLNIDQLHDQIASWDPDIA